MDEIQTECVCVFRIFRMQTLLPAIRMLHTWDLGIISMHAQNNIENVPKEKFACCWNADGKEEKQTTHKKKRK